VWFFLEKTAPQAKTSLSKSFPVEPGLNICIDPPTDGNCMFSVVAYLLNEKLQVNFSHDVVRAEAIRYLSADNVLLLDDKPFEYEQHIVTMKQTKQDYLNKMSRLGTFGDHIMLVAISCVYKVQFLVLSTLGEKAARLISATVDSCHVDTLPTLILGHFPTPCSTVCQCPAS
jgi:hypothetical protein